MSEDNVVNFPAGNAEPPPPPQPPVLKVAKNVLRFAIGLAHAPGGLDLLSRATPPIFGLIVKYGAEPLLSLLEQIGAPEISEEDIQNHLASKGLKVTGLDMEKLYGV